MMNQRTGPSEPLFDFILSDQIRESVNQRCESPQQLQRKRDPLSAKLNAQSEQWQRENQRPTQDFIQSIANLNETIREERDQHREQTNVLLARIERPNQHFLITFNENRLNGPKISQSQKPHIGKNFNFSI